MAAPPRTYWEQEDPEGVADTPARIEDHGGDPVIVTDTPLAPLTVEDVRAAIDRVRR
jgi:hypothetical protein